MGSKIAGIFWIIFFVLFIGGFKGPLPDPFHSSAARPRRRLGMWYDRDQDVFLLLFKQPDHYRLIRAFPNSVIWPDLMTMKRMPEGLRFDFETGSALEESFLLTPDGVLLKQDATGAHWQYEPVTL